MSANDVEMTPDAWAWVAVIGAGIFVGSYYLLRGVMLAALWVGGAA